MSATELSERMTYDRPVLRAETLALVRGGRKIFRNVNFTLAPGQALWLRGPNGCGKTSLLRLLAGALCPTEGLLHGRPEGTPAFLPADDALWQGGESVSAALSFWARLYGAALMPALQDVGLAALVSRRVALLSAGQKRRLSLARVLLQPSPLWLLDEPLNGLDRDGVDMFARVLAQHLAAGGMAVVASHDALPDLAAGTCSSLDLGEAGWSAAA